MNCVQVSTG